jgi:class 3 adenylate cyclase
MDMGEWLRSLGLDQYVEAFRVGAIDADILPELTDADLEKLGLPLGHRKRLLKAIAGLGGQSPAPSPAPRPAPSPAATAAGERRTLTVMFSDLVGSTALAASMDAEDWRDLVAAYHDAVASAVARFGGHVAQKMGDGALVYFGYPQAQENDAERGVRAGLAIFQELTALNSRLKAEAKPTLAARVGLHVGAVVIDAGSMAFGEVPNQAARVQSIAQVGEVLVSEDVHRLIAGQFVVEDRGAHELKGVPHPVTLYRVVRPSGTSRRHSAGYAQSPLMGRDEELAILASRWKRAREGEGQVVTIIGEPGIGKSRLVEEFRTKLADTPHTWIEWPCSQLLANAPFHPLVEWARQRFGGPDQPIDRRIGELERTLEAVKLNSAETIPLIAPLLDMQLPDRYPVPPMPPEEKRRRQLAVLVRWVIAGARAQPIVMMIEDVHWADPSTLELLRSLVDQGTTASLMLVLTARPEFKTPWPHRAHHAVAMLAPLGSRDTMGMIAAIAARHGLSAETVATVVARAAGIPLFIEEVTRFLLESGYRGGSQDVPVTLRASLMARLDRLGPAKEVAQIGAVLGREFGWPMIQAIAGLADEPLRAALERLVEADLIQVEGIPPEASYRFKHALIQDTAYEGLLKSRRRDLHRLAAQALPKHDKALADSHPELVAHHLTEGGENEAAVSAWKGAAEIAMTRNSFQEGIAHSQRALGLLLGLPATSERDQFEFKVRMPMAGALRLAKGLAAQETGAAYEAALAIGEKIGNVAAITPVLVGMGIGAFSSAQFQRAISIAARLERLADRSDGLPTRGYAELIRSGTHFYSGQLVQAISQAQVAVTFADQVVNNLNSGADPRAASRSFLSYALLVTGKIDAARREFASFAAYSDGIGSLYYQGLAATGPSFAAYFLSDVSAGVKCAETLRSIGQKTAIPLFQLCADLFGGPLLARSGQADEGFRQLMRGSEALEAQGMTSWYPVCCGIVADLLMARGDFDGARASTSAGIAAVKESQARTWASFLYCVKADAAMREFVILNSEVAAATEADYRTAIAEAQQSGARLFELKAATGLARLLRDQGDRAAARDTLAPIYHWFTEGLDTNPLIEAANLLRELG